MLREIIDNAQTFRDNIGRYCNPILSTEAEAGTQRFYLRKIEGAEVLLAYETNFFRQELHKSFPVAPKPPPILEVSLSTRKPRPTKLQKMLVEYGVENPDDLPEHAKGKANSLRRKAANAEAAAAAAQTTGPIMAPPTVTTYGSSAFFGPTSQSGGSSTSSTIHGHPDRPDHERRGSHSKGDSMDIDHGLHAPFGMGGPQLVGDNMSLSLEDRLLRGQDDDINLQSEAGKSKALEILARTEKGRLQAEKIWGPDVWGPMGRTLLGNRDQSLTPTGMDDMMKHDEGNVDQMFKEMTNQDDEEDSKRKDMAAHEPMTAESFESERNGMDALLDGE